MQYFCKYLSIAYLPATRLRERFDLEDAWYLDGTSWDSGCRYRRVASPAYGNVRRRLTVGRDTGQLPCAGGSL